MQGHRVGRGLLRLGPTNHHTRPLKVLDLKKEFARRTPHCSLFEIPEAIGPPFPLSFGFNHRNPKRNREGAKMKCLSGGAKTEVVPDGYHARDCQKLHFNEICKVGYI